MRKATATALGVAAHSGAAAARDGARPPRGGAIQSPGFCCLRQIRRHVSQVMNQGTIEFHLFLTSEIGRILPIPFSALRQNLILSRHYQLGRRFALVLTYSQEPSKTARGIVGCLLMKLLPEDQGIDEKLCEIWRRDQLRLFEDYRK